MDSLTLMQRVVESQDHPEQFLADLKRVRDDQSDIDPDDRFYQMELKLNDDDMVAAIAEVESYIEEYEQ